jgi:hypothetical protein
MGSCTSVPILTAIDMNNNTPSKPNISVQSEPSQNMPPPEPILTLKEVYENRDDLAPWTYAKLLQQNRDYEAYYGKPFEKK